MSKSKRLFTNLILDMDGVLWHGDRPVPGLQNFFTQLNRLDLRFILATNNATKTQVQYAEKLNRFGVDVSTKQILTSSEATAGYIRKANPDWNSAYVIGEIGLLQAMASRGFTVLDQEEVDIASLQADVVVAGMTRHVCYKHFAIASFLINHGAAFFGTNPDITFPSEIGKLPGAGSILKFLETSTGIEPTVIVKPNPVMFEEALRRLGGSSDDTIMVGDRLNTDIAGAQAVGLKAILLLSGIATKQDLDQSRLEPEWTFNTLVDLTAALPSLMSSQSQV